MNKISQAKSTLNIKKILAESKKNEQYLTQKQMFSTAYYMKAMYEKLKPLPETSRDHENGEPRIRVRTEAQTSDDTDQAMFERKRRIGNNLYQFLIYIDD